MMVGNKVGKNMAQNVKMVKTKFQGVYYREIQKTTNFNRPDVAYDVTYKINGRKIWKTVGYKSEGMTPVLASHKRADLIRGHYGKSVNPSSITLGFAWECLWKDKIQYNKSSADYKIRWGKHIAHLRNTKLDSVTKTDLQNLLNDKIIVGLRPRTILHIFMIIKQIFNYATKNGMFRGIYPGIDITLPIVDNKRHRYLTQGEAVSLMNNLKTRSVTTYEIAMISLHSGLRAGEIYALTGDKINIAEKLIVVTDTKSGKNRIVPMSRYLVTIFKDKPLRPDHLIFENRNGSKIGRLSTSFLRAVKSIGLNEGITDPRGKVVFHTLRHTYASWLVIEGVTLHTVAELLGHSTLEMTRRYAHLSPAVKRDSIAILERVWDSEATDHS